MITLLIVLAVGGLVIFGFLLYWMVMMILGGIFITFLFWLYLFSYYFMEPYNVLFAVVATGLVIWAFAAYGERSDRKKASSNS